MCITVENNIMCIDAYCRLQQVYRCLLFFQGTQKEDFDTRWKSLHIVKKSMENKVSCLLFGQQILLYMNLMKMYVVLLKREYCPFLSRTAPTVRDGRYCLSVCPSFRTFHFRTVTRRHIPVCP